MFNNQLKWHETSYLLVEVMKLLTSLIIIQVYDMHLNMQYIDTHTHIHRITCVLTNKYMHNNHYIFTLWGGVPGLDELLPNPTLPFLSEDFSIWKEHVNESSTLIIAPALSKSPAYVWQKTHIHLLQPGTQPPKY
jgi:hypothetical protein